jgi:hypothetical protein
LDHREFRLSGQYEEEFVAAAVELPRWTSSKGGDTAGAPVE